MLSISLLICLETANSEDDLCLLPSLLESILAKTSTSIDSNQLTEKLSLLESALTKNRGGGGVGRLARNDEARCS